MKNEKFPYGYVRVAPPVFATVDYPDILRAIDRHVSGDWGLAGANQKAANERALRTGGSLVSVHKAGLGAKVRITTEPTGSETVVSLE